MSERKAHNSRNSSKVKRYMPRSKAANVNAAGGEKVNSSKHPSQVRQMENATKALEHYVAMGDERSIRKLAGQIGVGYSTLQKWSVKYGWQDKLVEMVKVSQEENQVEPIDEQIRKKRFNLAVIDKMLRDVAVVDKKTGEVLETTVKLRNMNDFRTAVDLRDTIIAGPRGKGGIFGTGSKTDIQQAVFIIKK